MTLEDEFRQKRAYQEASAKLSELVTRDADMFEEYIKNHNELTVLGEETNFTKSDLDMLAYMEELDERLAYMIVLKSLKEHGYEKDYEDDYARWKKVN